ncbi:protein ANTAGONIST OF LIKE HETEROCHROMATIN PROTEIN 1-like [Vanessa cardui]|uniref:protein ANTAGONIST OF LIKE HETEROCHROMATIN PROTEIN 1-like n=1 Tax=Vanessa cardui TaxID=171605 RepID=UPI001F13BCC1|nr:protein ANTAGONIST OF LIKE HETEROCHROMATIN PROTEIN 1-like [Vanessa cardui]
MDEPTYFKLLELVTPLIKKQDTNMRQSIPPHDRLTATLRYLASGMSYEELKFPTAISPQRLGFIIPETCLAIMSALKDYMKKPQNKQEWKTIANDFEDMWQFPNCLGAVDGKHVRIFPPPGSGSYYWNYKKFHSIVLMACANAKYEFIWCEVGTNGRISDGGAIKNTEFYQKLCAHELLIPQPQKCKNSMNDLPFVFIGDEAFALRPDFIKPFNISTLSHERKIYNYRLSRVRRIIENVFGIMTNRFRIFKTSIELSTDRVDVVVLTCCILHNFLRKTCTRYSSDDIEDENTNTLPSLDRSLSTRNCSNDAKRARELYVNYFNHEGKVEWQENKV